MKNTLDIKVCGLKEDANINGVDALGVDFIGMIFYKNSPRFAGNVDLKLDNIAAKKVGVFVNASIDYIKEIKIEFNLDIAQLHGSESPEFCEQIKRLGLKVWKVFGIDNNFDFSSLDNFPAVDLFLFDTKSPVHGGTGIKFNWEKLNELDQKFKFMLSGGIGKNDVAAIKNLSLRGLTGIDLNSKFEITPGHKNVALLREFVKELKS
ncbi:MAG: phosphoribosylanthranilate isomerase [Saprospiraceae bacterium]|jgi:phosphoribosylanthranilate isomerase